MKYNCTTKDNCKIHTNFDPSPSHVIIAKLSNVKSDICDIYKIIIP